MASAQTSKATGVDVGTLEHRWGKSLIDAGWVALPSVFLQRQQALGLEPLDVNILLQLADHWWERDNLPFPSKKTLADRIGVKPRDDSTSHRAYGGCRFRQTHSAAPS